MCSGHRRKFLGLVGGALIVAIAACAPAGPSPATPPGPEPSPVAALPPLDDASVLAIAELLRLEDRREFIPSTFERALRDPHPEVRRRAALAAGRIRDARAVPLLREAVVDSSAAVRADAVFALGLVGDTARETVELLSALVRPATELESDLAIALEAIAALGRTKSPNAQRVLEEILNASAPPNTAAAAAEPEAARAMGDAANVAHPRLVQEALLAIWRHPRHARTADLLVPYLGSPDPELRWAAAHALMRLGEPRAVAALIDRLQDEDAGVRAMAARALPAPVADSAGFRHAAATALLGRLDDPHPHVRINAIRAIATYRDPAFADAVAARLADPQPTVPYMAAEALGQLGGPSAVRTLRATAGDTARPLALRAVALAALVRAEPETGVPMASTFASAADWLARFYAARALAGAPWGLAREPLRRLAADSDTRVAAAALDAVVALAGDSFPEAHALYVEGLASPDPFVRAAALRGIERRADPADLPIIMDAFGRAIHDTDNDAALAAVDALGALARNGMPVARAFFLRFERPADPILRQRIIQILGSDAWSDVWPMDTGRDLTFYVNVVRSLIVPAYSGEPAPRVQIHSESGTITIELAAGDAPLTVHNFLTLARRGYFNGGRWHRVVPNFVIQAGDSRGDGAGGPGYAIRDELNRVRYTRGTIGMAHSGPDTGGSQFFVTHSPQPHLDGGYTAFGRVVGGMDVADRVVPDEYIAVIEAVP
ncbi:MAG TPA: HEAT repeat domain-containing protein [Longimicrobiales bacterium]|nr:HEAT repeat domain-containing protein [Longimicrobiales bacterium]